MLGLGWARHNSKILAHADLCLTVAFSLDITCYDSQVQVSFFVI
jgi:hypothetical protein